MPRLMFVAALAVCTLTAPVLAAEMPATPYAGQQTRTIKALSDDEIAALRNGEGMGMAKAAELKAILARSMCSRSLRNSGLPKASGR